MIRLDAGRKLSCLARVVECSPAVASSGVREREIYVQVGLTVHGVESGRGETPNGRFELVDGVLVAQPQERAAAPAHELPLVEKQEGHLGVDRIRWQQRVCVSERAQRRVPLAVGRSAGPRSARARGPWDLPCAWSWCDRTPGSHHARHHETGCRSTSVLTKD